MPDHEEGDAEPGGHEDALVERQAVAVVDAERQVVSLAQVVPQGDIDGARLVGHLDRRDLLLVLGGVGSAHVEHDEHECELLLRAGLDASNGDVVVMVVVLEVRAVL